MDIFLKICAFMAVLYSFSYFIGKGIDSDKCLIYGIENNTKTEFHITVGCIAGEGNNRYIVKV